MLLKPQNRLIGHNLKWISMRKIENVEKETLERNEKKEKSQADVYLLLSSWNI